jgi:hypothetical protein
VVVNPSARLRDITSTQIVQETLKAVAVPGGDMTKMVESV